MMATRLGKGFAVKGDKITDRRHKLGSVSDQIRKRKSKKARPVTKIKAATKAQGLFRK